MNKYLKKLETKQNIVPTQQKNNTAVTYGLLGKSDTPK